MIYDLVFAWTHYGTLQGTTSDPLGLKIGHLVPGLRSGRGLVLVSFVIVVFLD